MLIREGSTIMQIATEVYGPNKLLALDLIKELNTQIENLNRVPAGQLLWLPPLGEETLVRRQPDGTYHLILGSFSRVPEAEQLAQQVRRKGYKVETIPRRMWGTFALRRVEIVGLKNVAAARQAWQAARAGQWVPYAGNPPQPYTP